MAETLTIRTASSTEVVKIAVPGPQGPKGDKGDPGDVAGLPLSTLGDTLYRGASENQRLPIGTSGQVLKVSAGGIPEWANESGAVSSVAGKTGVVTLDKNDVGLGNVANTAQVTSVTGTAPIVSSGGTTPAISINAATTSAAGSMSAADKTKLDGIASGATANTASTATPSALGTAAAGTSTDYARADHVHAMPSAADVGAAPASGIDPTAITGTAVVDNDARLSDSRTPSLHSSSHAAGIRAQYIGQLAGMTSSVFVRANNAGTAGNSITLTFNGSQTIANRLSAWNSANPSNAATLISGLGSQTPSNGEQIVLSGGAAEGSDPILSARLQDLTVVDYGTEDSYIRLRGQSDNTIEFQTQELSLNHTGGNNTPYISVSDGTDEALLGLRQGEMFLQGSNPIVRIEQGGGGLADIKIRNVIFEDSDSQISATFESRGNLSDNRIYDIPDSSGTLILGAGKARFSGQVAGMSEDVLIVAATAGTGGNSISLTFDGLDDIATVLYAWNTANPSNQASVISGGDGQVPDNGESIQLQGGTSGDARLSDARTPTSHAHGNLTNDGKIGSTAGLPVVTTTAGAVTTLALGTANQVLRVNSGASGVEFADPSGGGVTGAASSASDVLGVSGANITGVDANADRIVFWDDSASALKYLEAGSGLSISGTTLTATATGTIGGSTGSTDNAILRADGTGGSTSQSSALLIEDEVLAFTSITGDAGTDIITATGSAFANGQRVRFTALTGGSGLNTTTNYFVINVSGATFQLSTTEGGSASLFTTNITAGTLLTGHSVDRHVAIANSASDTNSCLWLKTKGTGAFIVDGSNTLATARGASAVDIQPNRGTNTTRVASGANSIVIGDASQASGTRSVCIGSGNIASAQYSMCLGGYTNSATAVHAIAFGQTSLADRVGARAFCSHTNSASGHRQELQFFMSQTTNNDTATEMLTDQNTSTARITIPSGKVMGGIVCVTGSKSDGSAVALYTRQFVIKNVGGTTTMPSQSTIGTDYEDNANTDITVEANDTNDALRVLVKGISGENWRWTAWVHCTEHFYGT